MLCSSLEPGGFPDPVPERDCADRASVQGAYRALVDDNLNPVRPGEAGELCVSGPQTTPGYWRAPDLTAQRYVQLPVSRHETRRFDRTGDLVASLPGGDYVFLGRADQQIKVLGHRVELGEIEAALREHPSVEHAVAFGGRPPRPRLNTSSPW